MSSSKNDAADDSDEPLTKPRERKARVVAPVAKPVEDKAAAKKAANDKKKIILAEIKKKLNEAPVEEDEEDEEEEVVVPAAKPKPKLNSKSKFKVTAPEVAKPAPLYYFAD